MEIEKKWFVYLGDRHDGPLSDDEVRRRLSAGVITTQHYLWTEGMKDWKVLLEIPELHFLLAQKEREHTQKQNLKNKILDTGPVEDTSPAVNLANLSLVDSHMGTEPIGIQATGEFDRQLQASGVDLSLDTRTTAAEEGTGAVTKGSRKGFIKPLLLVLLLGVGAYFVDQGFKKGLIPTEALKSFSRILGQTLEPLVGNWAEKIPLVNAWLSPLPALPEISKEDYTELKKAAQASLEEGPKLALAVSKTDLRQPQFLVGTNLPDQVQLTFLIRGVAETLLNQLDFLGTTEGTVQAKLVRSKPLVLEKGMPIPQGEFEITVFESDNQPESLKAIFGRWTQSPNQPIIAGSTKPTEKKVVLSQRVFLGGIRDDSYIQRLNAYHDKLVEKAQEEIKELQQYQATLSSQLQATSSQFDKLKGTKNARIIGMTWNKFSENWSLFQKNIEDQFQKQNTEEPKKIKFYEALYLKVRDSSKLIRDLHGLQSEFFAKKGDVKGLEIRVGEMRSSLQRTLDLFASELEQLHKEPKGSNGLPRKWESK